MKVNCFIWRKGKKKRSFLLLDRLTSAFVRLFTKHIIFLQYSYSVVAWILHHNENSFRLFLTERLFFTAMLFTKFYDGVSFLFVKVQKHREKIYAQQQEQGLCFTVRLSLTSILLLDKEAIAFYNIEQFKHKGGCFMEHALKTIIAACDKAIQEERFDALMEYYTEDAVLIIRPGQQAPGPCCYQKGLSDHCPVF